MNHRERFTLSYGPDLIVDERGITITPKPEYFEYLKSSARLNKSKKYTWSTYDLYTILIIKMTLLCIGGYFLWLNWIQLQNPKDGIHRQRTVVFTDLFNADDVPDYALEASGAQIIGKPSAQPYVIKRFKLIKFFSSLQLAATDREQGASSILQPWKSPGECWAFSGDKATVQIQLSHTIIPEAVTLEHIPQRISPTGHLHSAPKKFSIYSIGSDNMEIELLGDFEYMTDGPPNQSFQLRGGGVVYPTRRIQLEIRSNHGQPDYTCVYKLRVHGQIFRF